MNQLFRFLLVGLFNTGFGFAVIFACMYLLGLGPVVSNVIGYCCGLVTSYLLNRSYTFRSSARGFGEPAKFLAVFGVSYLANVMTLVALIEVAGLHEGLSQILAGATYVGISFILNKYFVFRQRRVDLGEQ